MANFETDFAVRYARAFETLYRRIGLDYFVIDCAEARDGRLLLFEAHVAMIVHNMDSAEIFPYKQLAMRKLFGAFQAALQKKMQPAAGQSGRHVRLKQHRLSAQISGLQLIPRTRGNHACID